VLTLYNQDYCTRGKVEHLIRMRERLDDHSRYLESQLAGLEALVAEKGEVDIVVPVASTAGTEQVGSMSAPAASSSSPTLTSLAPKCVDKEA